MAKHICKKMKSIIHKNITIQSSLEKFVCFLFIGVMILGVTVITHHKAQTVAADQKNQTVAADRKNQTTVTDHKNQIVDADHNNQTAVAHYKDRKTLNPQKIKMECLTDKKENNLQTVSRKKAEHLYHPIIIQTSNRYQVDPAIVKAIIMAESSYNPLAISKAGAKGLMQLMPETAQDLGVEDVFNPQQNINAGVRYFKQLVNRFNGDFELALAAYNAGSTTVRIYKGVPPFKATRHYIKQVFKYYQLYKNRMVEDMDRA